MFSVDFGTDAGGKHQFRELEDVSSFIEQQQNNWRATNIGKHNIQTIQIILSNWQKARNNVESIITNHSNDDNILSHIQNNISQIRLVSSDSTVGESIENTFERMGNKVASYVITYEFSPPAGQIIQNGINKDSFDGLMAHWLRRNQLTKEGLAPLRQSIKNTLDRLQRQADEHQEHLNGVFSDIDSRRMATDQHGDQQLLWAERARKAGFKRWLLDRKRWKREWSNLRNQYVEELKLRTAVALWTDRAENHETTSGKLRWIAIAVGVVGLLLTGVISGGALELAHWLFSDAFVTGKTKLPEGQLRPTWHYELIFTASATLLYLTIFLWLLRIVVRMFMTEHHLGIDARSRAAMAHTYLALTEKDKAEDADRAIVLAALFRPVADGLVKDDALPLITPASVLSGQLSGKV